MSRQTKQMQLIKIIENLQIKNSKYSCYSMRNSKDLYKLN